MNKPSRDFISEMSKEFDALSAPAGLRPGEKFVKFDDQPPHELDAPREAAPPLNAPTTALDQGDGEESRSSSTPLVPGTDAAIRADICGLLGGIASSTLNGETFAADTRVSAGVVEITGSTNAIMLYRRLLDLVPRMKSGVVGVKAIDISRFAHPKP